MYYVIKELRESTGLTQKKFAAMYGIPLSTLRKWEQGEASPAPYVVNLIARTLPATDSGLKKIAGKDGTVFITIKIKRQFRTRAETRSTSGKIWKG